MKKSDALGMRSKVAVIEDYQPLRGQVIDSGSYTGVPVESTINDNDIEPFIPFSK